MTNMPGSEWQEQELERFMAKHADDPSREHLSVKLSNPEEEREIDEVILHELWPGVVQALRGSRLTTWIGVNNNPAEGLETLHHQFITRALTFATTGMGSSASNASTHPAETPQARGPLDCQTDDRSGSRDVVVVGKRGCSAQGDDEGGEEARQGGADALQFHVASRVGSTTGSFERLNDVTSSRTGIVRSRRLLVSKGHVDHGRMRGAVVPGRRRRIRLIRCLRKSSHHRSSAFSNNRFHVFECVINFSSMATTAP